jgi:hypothetical protein
MGDSMSIVLQSTGGGSITINEPTTASNFTQTLPAATGTLLTTTTTGVCQAWGKNNGGASGIVSSYNISSITYTSTGNYTVAFTNALSDANYAIMSGAFISSANCALRVNSQSTTGFTCETLTNAGSNNNAGWAFSVFR